MSFPDLSQAPAKVDCSSSLRQSQQASQIFQYTTKSALPWPISLITSNETQDTWAVYENLLVSLLRTGDDRAARECVDRLWERFGKTNERVMALTGMYEEAVASNDEAIARIIKEYEDLLKEDPTNMPVRKRHIALLRSTNRTFEATTRLVELLDISPTDSEAWAELADIYMTQNMFAQARYCIEEVLLIVPNAWNMHAKLGEILYASTASLSKSSDQAKLLADLSVALRHFCRSVELCNDYLRGFYGIKVVAKRLLELPSTTLEAAPAEGTEAATPELATIKNLHELATLKLTELSKRTSEKVVSAMDEAEVIAARALITQDEINIPR